jgi:anthranilate synthase component 1
MTRLEQFGSRAKRANIVPVIDTMPADLLTPLAVYLKLSSASENSFLLESVEGGQSLARYSFIGADPRIIVRGGEKGTERIYDGRTDQLSSSIFDFLREHLANQTVATDSVLPSFVGGAIGYIGFDCVEWFEPSLRSGNEPVAEFMIFDSIVAFDHARQLILIVSLVFPETQSGGELEASIDAAETKNAAIRRRLECSDLKLPGAGTASPESSVTSNWNRPDFEDAVRGIKELIRAGEAYQVVLSQRLERKTNASPISIYRALRSINPSPYMFLLQMSGKSIIGASPEMLVRCRDGTLEYRPIAGTRPRSPGIDEDERLAEEMRCDIKEVAEHMMLVDLGRNDLGRVAKFGSVKVDRLMEVEKYSHVQHLVSQLSAELAEGRDRFDALAACFPAGTVSGAPKVRAIEIIRDLEPTPRGVYAGAVGYFDYGGNMDTCIAIRTLVLENGVAAIQAGAGIVADSIPEREYQETLDKARVMLRAIEMAEGAQ